MSPRARRLATVALAALPALAPRAAAAQDGTASVRGGIHALTLDVGVISAEIAYAQALGSGPFSLGAGVWGAWEPANNFARNVWEPLGATAFARYRAGRWLHADAGLTAARYVWGDDCSGCSGRFLGVKSSLMVGYGVAFFGPEVIVGHASDSEHGDETGVMWGGQARVSIGWGTREAR